MTGHFISGVTCLFIASKIEEIYPPKLQEFAYVTDGVCLEKEIISMELVILKTLNWGLSPMTPNAWMTLFMQTGCCYDTKEEMDSDEDTDKSFVTPQFSGLVFFKTMQLLDLVILDAGSLRYPYSILAASALCLMHNRELALAVSGYNWVDIKGCVKWMTAFEKALRVEPAPQPPSFQSVCPENQHNIQTHTLSTSTFDRAQKILQMIAQQSPEPSRLTTSTTVEMTPPESARDVRFVSTGTATANSTHMSVQQASVFLTPESPLRPSWSRGKRT